MIFVRDAIPHDSVRLSKFLPITSEFHFLKIFFFISLTIIVPSPIGRSPSDIFCIPETLVVLAGAEIGRVTSTVLLGVVIGLPGVTQ